MTGSIGQTQQGTIKVKSTVAPTAGPVGRWVLPEEDKWVTLNLDKPDWVSDPNDILVSAESTLGIKSTVVVEGHGKNDGGADALMFGYNFKSGNTVPNFISSSIAIAFKVEADKPDGGGTVEMEGFVSSTDDQDTMIGYKVGINWNGARSLGRGALNVLGSSASSTSGWNVGGLTSYGIIMFMDDQPENCMVTVRAPDQTVKNGTKNTALAAGPWTSMYVGVCVENNGTGKVTWENVVVKYKLISRPH
jgi:hypothetical protein